MDSIDLSERKGKNKEISKEIVNDPEFELLDSIFWKELPKLKFQV